jgi:hypothetical protein
MLPGSLCYIRPLATVAIVAGLLWWLSGSAGRRYAYAGYDCWKAMLTTYAVWLAVIFCWLAGCAVWLAMLFSMLRWLL